MAALALTPKERQALKARSHGLKPVVLVGNAGLTDAVIKEIDRALGAHELVKVRAPGDDRAERDAMFAMLADRLSAAPVQVIGKLLVFYRPAPAEERGPAAPAPRRAAASSADKRRR